MPQLGAEWPTGDGRAFRKKVLRAERHPRRRRPVKAANPSERSNPEWEVLAPRARASLRSALPMSEVDVWISARDETMSENLPIRQCRVQVPPFVALLALTEHRLADQPGPGGQVARTTGQRIGVNTERDD